MLCFRSKHDLSRRAASHHKNRVKSRRVRRQASRAVGCQASLVGLETSQDLTCPSLHLSVYGCMMSICTSILGISHFLKSAVRKRSAFRPRLGVSESAAFRADSSFHHKVCLAAVACGCRMHILQKPFGCLRRLGRPELSHATKRMVGDVEPRHECCSAYKIHGQTACLGMAFASPHGDNLVPEANLIRGNPSFPDSLSSCIRLVFGSG